MTRARTSFEKMWDTNLVSDLGDAAAWSTSTGIWSMRAPAGTRSTACARGLRPRSLGLTVGVVDHDPSTLPGRTVDTYPLGAERIRAMQANCREFGIGLVDLHDPRQGIVHVIGPELGITLPGCTLVCGDSHTATSGGLGA